METASHTDWSDALKRARAHSPFLARMLDRFPELEALLADGKGGEALAAARSCGTDEADVAISLRRERHALALVLAIGDLAGAFPLAAIMEELSALADRSLDRAIRAAISRRVPDAQPQGFIALALGKHGAGELNYSSDIDPILLYDPETLPRRERDEPGEAAQRYAREIVRLLSENTSEGYVFRVDLRLRPASEVSPLAISLDSATSHYESSALAWERAAFIRARACAGDTGSGEAFLESIRPFVWRRSLDFGAIDEIRRLTARIRKRYSGPVRPGPGFDLKQGRGGIREVEFFAQTHQLVHGGRDPDLRCRGTREALDALARAGHIGKDDAQLLGSSYDSLRVAEHRLQMVNDRQTHSLPDGEALENVARLAGFANADAWQGELSAICAPVAERFGKLIAENEEDLSVDEQVEVLDIGEPDALAARIEGWTDGRYRALRSPAALEAFDAVRPSLLEAMAEAPDPDMAFARWETLLERLPTAINFFRLLEARPGLLEVLVGCLTLAPPMAAELARRPELLDALIDRTAFDLPGDVDAIAAEMRQTEANDDYEQKLDLIRIVTGEKRFALGMQIVEARQDPLEVAEALSRTAEAALRVASDAAREEFSAKHGEIAGSELLVLGLGRFGGGALTHASDLDIIYLFKEGEEVESAGRRALGATLYYNRLAQRVSAALSVPTAEGALYEIDTRLRPQGAQGPLAVGMSHFERYQREDAWTWEHMALCRSRALIGSPSARDSLDKVVRAIIEKDRDPARLRKDVLAMRAEMAQHKQPRGVLDVKLLRGGLVDLEFLIHFLQLRDHVGLSNDLVAALAALVEAGSLPDELRRSHRLMTRILVAGRLLAPDLVTPSRTAAERLATNARRESFAKLLQDLARARQGVADAWHATFDEKLEIDDE